MYPNQLTTTLYPYTSIQAKVEVSAIWSTSILLFLLFLQSNNVVNDI